MHVVRNRLLINAGPVRWKIDSVIIPTVMIFGRANVGKSSLFNRMQKTVYNTENKIEKAMISDKSGTTREGKSVLCQLQRHKIILRDSGGVEEDRLTEVSGLIRKMRERALDQIRASGVVLLMVDAKAGVHPLDVHVASILKSECPDSVSRTILVANKGESVDPADVIGDLYEMGFGDPVLVSAKFNKGMGELFERIEAMLEEAG